MTTPMGTKFYLRPGVGFTWRAPGEEQYALPEGARPLVVIDPEDREQVERLASTICKVFGSETDSLYLDGIEAALREFASPTPPKPEEPTAPGAIVKDTSGVRWVSWREVGLDTHDRPWQRLEMDTDEYRNYSEIAAASVLYEGETVA